MPLHRVQNAVPDRDRSARDHAAAPEAAFGATAAGLPASVAVRGAVRPAYGNRPSRGLHPRGGILVRSGAA